MKKALVLLLILCAVWVGAQGQDWPRWRGPNGDGVSLETDWDPQAIAAGPRILWKAVVGTGYSNVVIRENRLYTMGAKKGSVWLYCLAADTGKEIWRFEFPAAEKHDPQSTPVLAGDRVYALGFDGTMVCLSGDGELLWQRDLVRLGAVRPYYGFAGSPIVEGDLLILQANASGLCLNCSTGELVWKSEKPPEHNYGPSTGTCYATPVVFEREGRRYATVESSQGLFAVDVKTGRPLWIHDWKKNFDLAGDQVADPIVFDDKVFFVQYYRDSPGSALLDTRGRVPKVLWKNAVMSSETSSPVLMDGRIYLCAGGGFSGRGSLRCLDPETGTMLWEEKFDRRPISLTAADGKLVVLDESGALFVGKPSPSGFGLMSKARLGGVFWRTSPVLCRGRLYCRDFATALLLCIDMRKR